MRVALVRCGRDRAAESGVGRPQPAGSRSIGARLAALALVLLAPLPLLAGPPAVTPARHGEHCVAPTDFMRRNHMKMLKHQRDETVRLGIRGEPFSLRECVACHAGRESNSVVGNDGDFCVACHRYAAVRIDCFECHSGSPSTDAVQTARQP